MLGLGWAGLAGCMEIIEIWGGCAPRVPLSWLYTLDSLCAESTYQGFYERASAKGASGMVGLGVRVCNEFRQVELLHVSPTPLPIASNKSHNACNKQLMRLCSSSSSVLRLIQLPRSSWKQARRALMHDAPGR